MLSEEDIHESRSLSLYHLTSYSGISFVIVPNIYSYLWTINQLTFCIISNDGVYARKLASKNLMITPKNGERTNDI
ncbi:hypothetical protein L2E82_49898 [Cichorium intybus]|uniref:Uncharacterized protein n=1 Tax=Cichorium intybus TaxID=13427 RepID=A0ACB8Z1K1_CICIN|nr:hypothetical protein L2E82_49898 [Cichorium intybus]